MNIVWKLSGYTLLGVAFGLILWSCFEYFDVALTRRYKHTDALKSSLYGAMAGLAVGILDIISRRWPRKD